MYFIETNNGKMQYFSEIAYFVRFGGLSRTSIIIVEAMPQSILTNTHTKVTISAKIGTVPPNFHLSLFPQLQIHVVSKNQRSMSIRT